MASYSTQIMEDRSHIKETELHHNKENDTAKNNRFLTAQEHRCQSLYSEGVPS